MASSYRSKRKIINKIKTTLRYILVLFLIILQLFIYYLIIFKFEDIPYITYASTIISLIVVTYIYNSDHNISYKLTWTVVCMTFSLTGTLFYLLYGNGKSLPKKKANKINAYLSDKIESNNIVDELIFDPIAYKHAKLLNYLTDGYPIYKNTSNTFFKDGKQMYLDMLDKLKNAKKFIFLEFFIISEGEVFNEVTKILEEKANNGIEIKIIYDDFGCNLKKKTIKRLSNVINIEITAYNPLNAYSPVINYRDHRKIVVIDGLYAYTGGMNLADEYVHKKIKYGHWRDNGLLVEGKACYSYTLLFAQNWYMSTKQMLLIEDYKPIYDEQYSEGYIIPYADAPTNKKNASYELFLSLINNATKSIYISTPYFVIDTTFINAITNAIKSGIDVKILIPNIADKKIIFQTTLAHFKNIILSGGEVYRYTPGFNHAKNIIVDSKYAFIGTVNIDYRSLFLNYECGNFLINTTTIKEIENDFLQTVKQSKKIEIEEWKKRPLRNRFQAFISTLLGPLL